MRIAVASAVAAALVAVAPAAAAPRVEVMVVGKTRQLRAPVAVSAPVTRVQVGRRRCAVPAGTPLAALAALRRPGFHVRDYGACSGRTASASESLYVDRIGPDRAGGASGWVFKIGHRTPSFGAASLQARVRNGGRVLWFFCRMSARGCQRTLEVSGPRAPVAAGAAVSFIVRGYDDRGRSAPVAGATVSGAGASATTGPDGRATLTASGPGRYRISATAAGTVPAFPFELVVSG